MSKEYKELEISILSCLLQKPELMEELKLEDKYFIHFEELWFFMKTFYKRFGTFDVVLMTNTSRNKYKIMDYVTILLDRVPSPSMFNKYQDALIEMYNETKKNRYIRENILELAHRFYLHDIEDIQEFKNGIDTILDLANEIYREEETTNE